MKPTVLILTTTRWFSTARLAISLSRAGCDVQMVCPPNHPVGKANAVSRTFDYRGLSPLRSFREAIVNSRPELLIPADDLATRHLHDLYERDNRSRKANHTIRNVIERSLGNPENYSDLYKRATVMDIAAQEGVRVPRTTVVTDFNDLKRWITENGFPFALKADRTSGGMGVKIVHSAEEARAALVHLQSAPTIRTAVRQAWSEHDTTLLRPSMLGKKQTVNVQAFVPGRNATSTVLCWQGTVLASLHFEVIHSAYSSGPATVVRLIDNDEMSRAAEKIVRRFNLSGFLGFDFILEANSGYAYLIEMNPRATQGGHLTFGPGRDLPAALCAALTDGPEQLSPTITENDTIAYFPQEWLRDAASPFLRSAYHDVPWDQPDFVRACVHGHSQPPTWDTRPAAVPALSSAHVRRS